MRLVRAPRVTGNRPLAFVLSVALACSLPLALLAGGGNGDPQFIRGDIDGDFGVDADDVAALTPLYENLEDLRAGCDSGLEVVDPIDVNDNGDSVTGILTIADIVTLQSSVVGTAALPPPAMCDFDLAASTTELQLDGALAVTLEAMPFANGMQEIVVKVRTGSPGFAGGTFPLHGVGLVLHADPTITDADFLPALPSAPDFLFIVPPDVGDVLLLHVGSVAPLAAVGGADIVLGSIILDMPAGNANALTPPADGDGDGLPDPVQVGAREWVTTVVAMEPDCFPDPNSGLPSPCFVDHVPTYGAGTASPTEFRRGDGNADGRHDIADGVFLLQALFLAGTPPECPDAADFDANGTLGLGDAMGMFTYQLLDGPPPAAPFPGCGIPSGGERLGCPIYSPLCE